jgi:hypothetical protein
MVPPWQDLGGRQYTPSTCRAFHAFTMVDDRCAHDHWIDQHIKVGLFSYDLWNEILLQDSAN